MASSEVSAVTAGAQPLSVYSARSRAADSQPQPTATQTTSDSAPAVAQEPSQGGTTSGAPGVRTGKENHVSADEAERIAEGLKKALESVRETRVTFLSDRTNSNHISLSFQVVDAHSGEVLSEFPRKVTEAIKSHAGNLDSHGLLVEDDA